MNDEHRTDPDARLRALLRDADPAAGDRLATEEVWALRRTALHAAEKAGRRAWLATPALAAAAAGIAAAVFLWVFQVRPEAPAAAPPRAAAAARPVSVEPEPAPPVPQPPPAAPDPPSRAPIEEPLPAPPTPPVLAEAADERPLHIEFATPGGTRIIWVLTAESES